MLVNQLFLNKPIKTLSIETQLTITCSKLTTETVEQGVNFEQI